MNLLNNEPLPGILTNLIFSNFHPTNYIFIKSKTLDKCRYEWDNLFYV